MKCQHCEDEFAPHGTETFCSGFCAHRHLQVHYAAYGFEAAPRAGDSDDFYQAARHRETPPAKEDA